MRLYHNPDAQNPGKPLLCLNRKALKWRFTGIWNGIVKDDIALLAGLQGIVRKGDAGREVMASLNSVEDIAALLLAEPTTIA